MGVVKIQLADSGLPSSLVLRFRLEPKTERVYFGSTPSLRHPIGGIRRLQIGAETPAANSVSHASLLQSTAVAAVELHAAW